MSKFNPEDNGYVDVAARIVEFRDKYPNGSLQPANLDQPFTVQTIGDQTFIAVVAAAYRTPDDPKPGIGMAYEQFPGRTPYTKGSELMNAETSAWGRAIVAALAADTKRGIASAHEVRNRQAERDQGNQEPSPADKAREEIRAYSEAIKLDTKVVAQDFQERIGKHIMAADANELGDYLAVLKSEGLASKFTEEYNKSAASPVRAVA